MNKNIQGDFQICISVPLNKIENLPRRALWFFLNDYDSTYNDLLKNSGYTNMNLRSQKTLCIEIYKTLNKLHLSYMNDIYKLINIDGVTCEKYKINLEFQNPINPLLKQEA